jgi:hypothetical protein
MAARFSCELEYSSEMAPSGYPVAAEVIPEHPSAIAIPEQIDV